MSGLRLIASYSISLAVLWLITSIAAGVWIGSVSEGVGLATAVPFAPPLYGVAVLVADWEDLSLVDKKFVLAMTCLTSSLVLIASVITAFCKRAQKRWLVVSQVLLVVYWAVGAWVTYLLAYALSHMP
ncbi:MAG: hypothetical protein QGF59_03000 [Pirellulaceae bacterium]|jgi:hypothetical protein|nr:hypothetical protein [Planctomycetaceae bacterium]MDP6717589.1 hypothetical protein [Pirellulaceae bacterium]